jgi:hypothetical protein
MLLLLTATAPVLLGWLSWDVGTAWAKGHAYRRRDRAVPTRYSVAGVLLASAGGSGAVIAVCLLLGLRVL